MKRAGDVLLGICCIALHGVGGSLDWGGVWGLEKR
jgi:hypothetical protein